MSNEMPQDFIDAITATFGAVHPDTPSHEETEAVMTCEETQRRIQEAFGAAGLELTPDAVDAINKDYKLSAAFLHDYSDLVNEDGNPAQIEDYHRVMERAIQKIVLYIRVHGDPHYNPLAKVMDNFYSAISDDDVKEMADRLVAMKSAQHEDTQQKDTL